MSKRAIDGGNLNRREVPSGLPSAGAAVRTAPNAEAASTEIEAFAAANP